MKIIKAINFAAEKHKGQERRGTGLPYLVHPIIVSQLILKYKGDSKHIEDLQVAAILHDTLEDTECSYAELEREFGSLVASIVLELSNDQISIKELGKNKYLMNKMLNMSNYTFILKLVDRYSNILDTPAEKYITDTIKLVDFILENRDCTRKQTIILVEIKNECEKLMLV